MTRQQLRYAAFRLSFREVKEKYGCGIYSWTEGITRKSARKIARKLAKRRAA